MILKNLVYRNSILFEKDEIIIVRIDYKLLDYSKYNLNVDCLVFIDNFLFGWWFVFILSGIMDSNVFFIGNSF